MVKPVKICPDWINKSINANRTSGPMDIRCKPIPQPDYTPPPVAVMVHTAVKNMNEDGGSSASAIIKYIASIYKVQRENTTRLIKKEILNGLASGTLIQTSGQGLSGSFKIGKKYDPKKKAKPVTSDQNKKTMPVKKRAAKKVKKRAVAKQEAPLEKQESLMEKLPEGSIEMLLATQKEGQRFIKKDAPTNDVVIKEEAKKADGKKATTKKTATAKAGQKSASINKPSFIKQENKNYMEVAENKITTKKESPRKKPSITKKKSPTRKTPVTKKNQTAVEPPTKKPLIAEKEFPNKKPAILKKEASAKKPPVTKNEATTKKPLMVKKEAPAKKSPVTKNTQTKKATSTKKVPVKKQQVVKQESSTKKPTITRKINNNKAVVEEASKKNQPRTTRAPPKMPIIKISDIKKILKAIEKQKAVDNSAKEKPTKKTTKSPIKKAKARSARVTRNNEVPPKTK